MPLLERINLQDYAEHAKNAPGMSLWQSLEWKGYQEALGRETRLYGLKNGEDGWRATALVVIDRTAFGLSTWDIPRGPLGTTDACTILMEEIVAKAKGEGCMTLYFSPTHYSLLTTPSSRHEQPEATLVLDLTLEDAALLQQMHPKGRYNVRLAERHGVRVEESKDSAAFHALLLRTAARDGFTPLPPRHYASFLEHLPGSFLLLAFHPSGQRSEDSDQLLSADRSPLSAPIAALLGVTWGGAGIYYYGASDYGSRALMAPAALQWAAMRLCRARGCTRYDLLGIAPLDEKSEARNPKSEIRKKSECSKHFGIRVSNLFRAKPVLSPVEGGFGFRISRPHRWAGVTRFKRQFGGTVVTYPREQEVVLRPVAGALIRWKRKLLG